MNPVVRFLIPILARGERGSASAQGGGFDPGADDSFPWGFRPTLWIGSWGFRSWGVDHRGLQTWMPSRRPKNPVTAQDVDPNSTDTSVAPWVPPNPLGYGYGDKYQYKLFDKDGEAMPAVYVKEDLVFDSGTPPPPMALWTSLLSPAGNLNSVDKILVTGSPYSYPSSGSPILSGTHRYKGGIKTWSESRGLTVKTSSLKIWTDATQN